MSDSTLINPILVLSSRQMEEADAYTINSLGVSGNELMERAGEALLKEVLSRRPEIKKITVLCGKGNNGGDGFVIARRASERGLEVAVVTFAPHSAIKDGAKIAFDKCLNSKVKLFDATGLASAFASTDCIVDALYGIKFRGSLSDEETIAANIANELRKNENVFLVAVDLPSGVICDTGAVNGASFECDLTVTFQAFKPAHFCFPAAKLSGERVAVDIGIDAKRFSNTQLITPDSFEKSLLLPSFGHKGIRGHMLVVAGSPGHSGAAALTTRAGLRAGAGLVTLFSDQETSRIAVEVTPEIMTSELEEKELEKILSVKKGALVIGPGIDLNFPYFAKVLLHTKHLPKVIDATALRILAENDFENLLDNAVLTPHPGELAAILNCSTEDIAGNRFDSVRKTAAKYKCAVVLKGAYTLIGFKDGQVLVSPFANSNLGTAGSGDVLSGLIGGLLSRGFSIETASSLGVYLHGQIGSNLLPNGVVGSLASEFAENFPAEFANLVTNKNKRWEVVPAVIC